MHLRRIDPAAVPADLAAILPVWRSALSDALPGLPMAGEDRLRTAVTATDHSEKVCLAAFPEAHASDAVGMAIYTASTAVNLDACRLLLLVAPQAHRRGVGTALFQAQLRQAAEAGRQRLITQGPVSDSMVGFARRHGGKRVDRDIMSILDIRALDVPAFEGWAAPDAKNRTYRVRHWDDRCPDELAATFCRAADAMADAPTNSTLQRMSSSVERLRADEQRFAHLGVRRFVTAALDDTDTVAGYTLTGVVRGEPAMAQVWNSVVLRSHRGHGLGLRLKAAAALRLRASQPAVQCITTVNNEDNEPMLRINRALGYRKLTDWLTYEYPVPVPQ
jgi:GNAT superfamily N-acetyltransferase